MKFQQLGDPYPFDANDWKKRFVGLRTRYLKTTRRTTTTRTTTNTKEPNENNGSFDKMMETMNKKPDKKTKITSIRNEIVESENFMLLKSEYFSALRNTP